MRITALKTNLAAVVVAMDGMLQVAADDGGRDLTAEEQATFDAKAKEAETLKGQIAREENLLALKSTAAAPANPREPPPCATVRNRGQRSSFRAFCEASHTFLYRAVSSASEVP